MTRRDSRCRRCGHPRERHEHYRAGDDCGTCGRAVCPAYVGPLLGAVRSTLARLGLRRTRP